MIPSLVAGEVRRGIVEYLTTTFALADADTRDALRAFLEDPDEGIFRGPFLRVRPPFKRLTMGGRRRSRTTRQTGRPTGSFRSGIKRRRGTGWPVGPGRPNRRSSPLGPVRGRRRASRSRSSTT